MSYVCIKLSTGETLFGMLESESETEIVIYYPMVVDPETFTASPYCPFVDDRIFYIKKKYVVFMKGLEKSIIMKYKRLVAVLLGKEFEPIIEIEEEKETKTIH